MSKNEPLEKIVQKLIINGTLTDQSGLFYGKTGVAVFFFHYARLTGNELYQDYAMELLETIQNQITVTISMRYDIGLAGIGVGLEYLLQNVFLEANDDIFDEFDAKMYRTAMYEPYPDFSLEGGLAGWGRYFVYRLRGNGRKDSKLHEAMAHIADEISQRIVENSIPENEQPDVFRFLHDLTLLPEYAAKYDNLLKNCKEWKCIRELDVQTIFPYMSALQRLYSCQNYFNIDLTEEIGKEWTKWKETDKESLTDMGFLKGWTTEGLLHLVCFNRQNDSWINLL